MSEENSDTEMIPGITIPLAKIVPKRRSSRKRAPPDLFVPTHSLPSRRLIHGQSLRRGPGRPPKQRSDVEGLSETISLPLPECPASPPLRRVLGHPRKQRSDEIDVEVPSMETTQSPASQPFRRGPGRPGKQPSDVTEAPAVSPPSVLPLGWTGDSPLQASTTTPLGSTSDRTMEVPSDEEETKLNARPSRILMRPPKTNYTPQEILDEESKKLIIKVKSLLVRKLLTHGNDIDYMVHQANATFRYLKGLDVEYGSFYRDVTEHIKNSYDLQDAEKEETTLSLSALQKNYENAIHSAGVVGEDFGHAQEEWEKAKEKKETLKRKIEDLKKEVAHIEHEEERLKHEEIKYKEAHEVAKAKIQELGIQLEAAQAKLREIEQRKNAAFRGIESSTRHLQSRYLDDLN